jgi:hypothetical protein
VSAPSTPPRRAEPPHPLSDLAERIFAAAFKDLEEREPDNLPDSLREIAASAILTAVFCMDVLVLETGPEPADDATIADMVHDIAIAELNKLRQNTDWSRALRGRFKR